jgi:hypothetical protein
MQDLLVLCCSTKLGMTKAKGREAGQAQPKGTVQMQFEYLAGCQMHT